MNDKQEILKRLGLGFACLLPTEMSENITIEVIHNDRLTDILLISMFNQKTRESAQWKIKAIDTSKKVIECGYDYEDEDVVASFDFLSKQGLSLINLLKKWRARKVIKKIKKIFKESIDKIKI